MHGWSAYELNRCARCPSERNAPPRRVFAARRSRGRCRQLQNRTRQPCMGCQSAQRERVSRAKRSRRGSPNGSWVLPQRRSGTSRVHRRRAHAASVVRHAPLRRHRQRARVSKERADWERQASRRTQTRECPLFFSGWMNERTNFSSGGAFMTHGRETQEPNERRPSVKERGDPPPRRSVHPFKPKEGHHRSSPRRP